MRKRLARGSPRRPTGSVIDWRWTPVSTRTCPRGCAIRKQMTGTVRRVPGATSQKNPLRSRSMRPPHRTYTFTMSFPPEASAEGSCAQARVERVAQSIADEVESDHGHEEGGAGPEDDPRRLLEIAAPGVDHAAPRRGGGLDAQPEERERCLGEDGEGHAQRGLDHDGRGRIRQDVTPRDAPARRAQRPGSLHVLAAGDRQNLPAHQASERRSVDDAEGDDDADQP